MFKKEQNEIIMDLIGKDFVKSRLITRNDLECFKRKMAKKHKIPCLKNSELLKIYHKKLQNKSIRPCLELENILRKRPVRSLSGIVNVSVLTKPYPCPGKCIFCPQEKNVPKSYLKNEPAVQRAIANKFNPYQQVIMRLRALNETGHPIDKVELRIIGGTWSFYPKQYQMRFVAECFRACNNFNRRIKNQESRIKNLKLEHKRNEKVKCRVVGISVETRPDYINLEEIKWLRELGITKVELGVQTLYDDVLKLNHRGHNINATIEATRWLKNAGFKVSYQIMPGLYGSSLKRDAAMFQELFNNPDFKPDYLKIYPLALVKNTKIYKLYQQKKFKPYNKTKLLRLLLVIKKEIPYWCRVERIIRDIPSSEIVEGGSRILNFREILAKEMQKKGLLCKCVRCREVKENFDVKEKIFLFREDYTASKGKEIFLSFENKTRAKLYALLRLRLPKEPSSFLRFPQCQTSVRLVSDTSLTLVAIVRDLHTYGQLVKIDRPQGSVNSAIQHKGLGKKLIQEAEKIASREFGLTKIAVIAAVGTRNYYRKLGYRLKETYMVKRI